MNRLNRILAAILAVQVVIAAVILWPRPSASSSGEPLLPGVTPERVVRVTIRNDDGQHITLARAGDGWVMPEADDYPVREKTVPDLLDKIVQVKAERLVTQTPDSHRRLQVAEDRYKRLIELELDDGSVQRLYLGTSPGYNATHVRAEGEDPVYLTSALSVQDAEVEARGWIETTYLEIPKDQIVALRLENANGVIELEKGEDGNWTLTDLAEGEEIDSSKAASLVSQAYYTTMLTPLGKEEKAEYGMDDPTAIVTARTRDEAGTEKTYTLRIGAHDPQSNSYVVISSESPYYVRVGAFAVKEFVEQKRGDLLKQPPTPEVTPTPSP
ncbi:MAG TPA: DUF4340 domain-containing protein [Anaerolineae bacterium]|nr:DUF4340 domain-containing protein [Anaerolineae bacterium]